MIRSDVAVPDVATPTTANFGTASAVDAALRAELDGSEPDDPPVIGGDWRGLTPSEGVSIF
jgi:hypothetical protein